MQHYEENIDLLVFVETFVVQIVTCISADLSYPAVFSGYKLHLLGHSNFISYSERTFLLCIFQMLPWPIFARQQEIRDIVCRVERYVRPRKPQLQA